MDALGLSYCPSSSQQALTGESAVRRARQDEECVSLTESVRRNIISSWDDFSLIFMRSICRAHNATVIIFICLLGSSVVSVIGCMGSNEAVVLLAPICPSIKEVLNWWMKFQAFSVILFNVFFCYDNIIVERPCNISVMLSGF